MSNFHENYPSHLVKPGDTIRFTPYGKKRAILVKIIQVADTPGQANVWGMKIDSAGNPIKSNGFLLPATVDYLLVAGRDYDEASCNNCGKVDHTAACKG